MELAVESSHRTKYFSNPITRVVSADTSGRGWQTTRRVEVWVESRVEVDYPTDWCVDIIHVNNLVKPHEYRNMEKICEPTRQNTKHTTVTESPTSTCSRVTSTAGSQKNLIT